MGLYDVSSATTTDLSSAIAETSIDTQDTEIQIYSPNWVKWHGLYRKVPELQATIDKVSMWTAGKGVKAKEESRQKQIDKIKGFGKDTIRDIVINLIRTARICGDAFAEIVWGKRGELLNLIPRSPGTIQIVTDNRGMIKRYEQISLKTNGRDAKKTVLATWQPEQMFHLCWNRIADETHGISTIEKIEDIIIKRKDAQDMMQLIFRRLLFPVRMIEVDTDDDTKMAAMKTKYQTLIDKGEVMLVSKDTTKLTTEQLQAVIKDSMEWILFLQKYFVLSEGVPEVILGSINSKDTEGASKILYLAYEQVVKNGQNYFEEQWKSQIGFEIDLPEPPSIDPMILEDSRKAGSTDASKGNQSMKGKDSINPAGQNK